MLNLERIFQQDRLLRAMTGLHCKAFEALLPSFAAACEQRWLKADVQRKRAVGGGRNTACCSSFTPAESASLATAYLQ